MISSDSGIVDATEPCLRATDLHVTVHGRTYRETEASRGGIDLSDLALGATTSCPSPGDYLQAIRAVEGDRVIVLTPHGALSGAFAAARVASSVYAQESARPIDVVDTETAAAAYALVCRAALASVMAAQSTDDLINVVSSASASVRMYGIVSTLTPLRRGGRITHAIAKAIDHVGVQFMFEMRRDVIRMIGMSRTETRALETLAGRAGLIIPGPAWAVGIGGQSRWRATRALILVGRRVHVVRGWAYRAGAAMVVHAGASMVGFALAPASACMR